MKSNKLLSFLMLFSISFSYSINAEPIPLEKLLCGGSASGGTLSPSGRYYAAMVPSTPPKCSIDEPEDDEMYVVEKILKERTRNGKKQYLVRWRNYPPAFDSWEPAENVQDVLEG